MISSECIVAGCRLHLMAKILREYERITNGDVELFGSLCLLVAEQCECSADSITSEAFEDCN